MKLTAQKTKKNKEKRCGLNLNLIVMSIIVTITEHEFECVEAYYLFYLWVEKWLWVIIGIVLKIWYNQNL